MTAALLVAHPGHELRVHEWLAREKPLVLVLTDGSGSREAPRIAATRRLLASVGARPGPVFGRLADRQLYEALLGRDHGAFAALLEEMEEVAWREGVRVLAGDAAEGLNPAHDVARLLANAVASRLAGRGRPVENLEFPLVAAPAAGRGEVAVALELDDAALARKEAAARAYPGLAGEVEEAFSRHGLEAFRREVLRRAVPGFDLASLHGPVPPYERVGEQRVAQGVYAAVLRFEEHVRPLAECLAALTGRDTRA